MPYCEKCGTSVGETDAYCPNCGAPVRAANYSTTSTAPTQNSQDTGSIGWAILGFLFPLIGLILWAVWRDNQPKNAHSAIMGAIVGVLLSVVMVLALIGLVMIASVSTEIIAF